MAQEEGYYPWYNPQTGQEEFRWYNPTTGGFGDAPASAAAGGGGGEEGGEEGIEAINLPPSVYYQEPTQPEMDWMNTFNVPNYGEWVNDTMRRSYNDFNNNIESEWNRILGNPDTSMFAYPEETLKPLHNLGDIVSGYYDTVRPKMVSAYDRDVLPTIAEQYAGPGYWGTARADAVTRGMTDLTDKLSVAEAGDYASAQKQGLLTEAQAKLSWDEAKRNYLSTWEQGKKQNLASLIASAGMSQANTEQSMLAQAPNITGATAAYSRQFEIPQINPEFMAELAYNNMMLGLQPFDTAGWFDQPDQTGWANLLGTAATAFAGSAKNWTAGNTWNTPSSVNLSLGNFESTPSYDMNIGSGTTLPNGSTTGNNYLGYTPMTSGDYSSDLDLGTYWNTNDYGNVTGTNNPAMFG